MGRYRKRLTRTAGVQATEALNSNPVVALEPVSPVMTVAADTQPFTAQGTTDIRFMIGIIIRTQYG
jgi:hypothetical protein